MCLVEKNAIILWSLSSSSAWLYSILGSTPLKPFLPSLQDIYLSTLNRGSTIFCDYLKRTLCAMVSSQQNCNTVFLTLETSGQSTDRGIAYFWTALNGHIVITSSSTTHTLCMVDAFFNPAMANTQNTTVLTDNQYLACKRYSYLINIRTSYDPYLLFKEIQAD